MIIKAKAVEVVGMAKDKVEVEAEAKEMKPERLTRL
jgi:hypothetical protein